MGEMIPLYGFKGRNGATLTITAPVGATVTVSKDGKSKLPKLSAGTVVFKGLSTGTWTITITNGTDTATKTVEIKADYEADITFFTATLHISYPAGAVCKATNGSTVLTAPDTSGTWACTVDKKGTWTVTAGDLTETVTLSTTGETKTVILVRWVVKNGVLTDIGLTKLLVSGRNVTHTQETGYVAIENAQSLVTGIATGQTLDLTAARKIVADIDVTTVGASKDYTQYDGINLVTSKAISAKDVPTSIKNMTAYLDADHIADTTGRKTLELDVSGLTGSHYVGFAIGTKGAFNVYSLYVL